MLRSVSSLELRSQSASLFKVLSAGRSFISPLSLPFSPPNSLKVVPSRAFSMSPSDARRSIRLPFPHCCLVAPSESTNTSRHYSTELNEHALQDSDLKTPRDFLNYFETQQTQASPLFQVEPEVKSKVTFKQITRSFISKIHPDLFIQNKEHYEANQKALREFTSLVDAWKKNLFSPPYKRRPNFKLHFFFRNPQGFIEETEHLIRGNSQFLTLKQDLIVMFNYV